MFVLPDCGISIGSGVIKPIRIQIIVSFEHQRNKSNAIKREYLKGTIAGTGTSNMYSGEQSVILQLKRVKNDKKKLNVPPEPSVCFALVPLEAVQESVSSVDHKIICCICRINDGSSSILCGWHP